VIGDDLDRLQRARAQHAIFFLPLPICSLLLFPLLSIVMGCHI
jgi:hypothetical protein